METAKKAFAFRAVAFAHEAMDAHAKGHISAETLELIVNVADAALEEAGIDPETLDMPH